MNLRYIIIRLDETIGDRQYRSWFSFHTRFICNYLSKEIRKFRFVTDGTFKMISINVGGKHSPRIGVNQVLDVSVPFNQNEYESIKGTNCSKYYIELFKLGFHEACTFKTIPISELLLLLDEFEKNHYLNTWTHIKKSLKQINLKLHLKASFTTNRFSLFAEFYDIKTSRLICQGELIRTLPDEIYFSRTIKDVIVRGEHIIFIDYNGNDLIEMEIKDILMGHFLFAYSACPDYYNQEDIK